MRKSAFIPIGLIGAVIVAAFGGDLKVAVTPAWSAGVTAQLNHPVRQSVDRALKSDRLSPASVASARLRRTALEKLKQVSTPVPVLIEGCDAVVSVIVDSPLARIAGSCQT
jgi:hypothetical protein